MKKYSELLSDEVIQKMLVSTAIVVHGQAVMNAQRDQGGLQNSISWTTKTESGGENSTGGQSATKDQLIKNTNDDKIAIIGSAIEYAAAQEYGRPDIPSYTFNAYLRPAVAQTKSKVEKLNSKILKEEIHKMAAKK